MKTDAIVVGAGPAGCAAAYDLAQLGIRVLLVDRTPFPRRKPCAGGLTVKTVRSFRYSVRPVIRHTVNQIAISCRMRNRRILASRAPICHMVDRSAFDHFCLQRTLSAGADFSIVRRIDAIDEDRSGVAMATERGVLRSRFLVGADGVHSRVRRLTGRFTSLRMGFAVEGRLASKAGSDPAVTFDFSRVSGGYGWVFPKKDHVNIGLYTQRTGMMITRRDWEDYAGVNGIGGKTSRIAGYALGMGGWRYRPGSGRILLVGDAAGLVDPLLGEGLYHAVSSGQRAAGAISEALRTGCDACRSYAHALVPLQRDLLLAQIVANLFYRLPAAGHWLLTSSAARIPLIKGFSLGMPFSAIFCNGYRFWLNRPVQSDTNQNTF